MYYLHVYTHNNASSPYAQTSRRFPKSCCASPAIFFCHTTISGISRALSFIYSSCLVGRCRGGKESRFNEKLAGLYLRHILVLPTTFPD